MSKLFLVLIFPFLCLSGECLSRISGTVTSTTPQPDGVLQIVTDTDRLYYIYPRHQINIGDTLSECWENYSKKYIIFKGYRTKYPTIDSYMYSGRRK